MPRSTTETTGTSGSRTVASTAQACSTRELPAARSGGAGSGVPKAASIITTRRPETSAADAASRPARSRGARCGGRSCRCCGTRARRAATGRPAESTAAKPARQSSRRSAQRGPRRAASASASIGVGLEDLGEVRPEQVERRLQARRRFLRAVAEADDPVGGVLAVVARFLDGLAGDRRELAVARAFEPLPEQLEEDRDGAVPQHRHREVAARQLDQRAVAEVALVAQEGELVLVVARSAELAFELAGAGEHRARLADEIERHVAEGDVFLDDRRMAAPLGEALRQDQAGVADAQQVLHGRVRGDGDRLHRRRPTCDRATWAARRRSGGGRPCLPSDRSTPTCRPGRSPTIWSERITQMLVPSWRRV